MELTAHLARGALAGAAGTAALHAATYLDMAVRGRPASSTPERSVDRLLELTGLSLPGDEAQRGARRSALGALLGIAAGVGAGTVLGGVRALRGPQGPVPTTALAWATAMAVGNGPMVALQVTDPRTWSRADWLADVVPHLAYAVTTASAFEAMEHSSARAARRRRARTSRARLSRAGGSLRGSR